MEPYSLFDHSFMKSEVNKAGNTLLSLDKLYINYFQNKGSWPFLPEVILSACVRWNMNHGSVRIHVIHMLVDKQNMTRSILTLTKCKSPCCIIYIYNFAYQNGLWSLVSDGRMITPTALIPVVNLVVNVDYICKLTIHSVYMFTLFV